MSDHILRSLHQGTAALVLTLWEFLEGCPWHCYHISWGPWLVQLVVLVFLGVWPLEGWDIFSIFSHTDFPDMVKDFPGTPASGSRDMMTCWYNKIILYYILQHLAIKSGLSLIEYVLNFNSLRIMVLKTKLLLGGFRDCTFGFSSVDDMNPTHILSVVWPHSTSTVKGQSHRISTQYMYPTVPPL